MKDKDLLKILKKTAGKWSGYTAATMFFRILKDTGLKNT